MNSRQMILKSEIQNVDAKRKRGTSSSSLVGVFRRSVFTGHSPNQRRAGGPAKNGDKVVCKREIDNPKGYLTDVAVYRNGKLLGRIPNTICDIFTSAFSQFGDLGLHIEGVVLADSDASHLNVAVDLSVYAEEDSLESVAAFFKKAFRAHPFWFFESAV